MVAPWIKRRRQAASKAVGDKEAAVLAAAAKAKADAAAKAKADAAAKAKADAAAKAKTEPVPKRTASRKKTSDSEK